MRLDLYPLEKETDEKLLVRLSEECAEVIVAINKCQRFGLENHHPNRSISNLDALRYEIIDVQQCIAELERRRE
jgi:NTP pyrophosphatase (non-canonical NTP hydrolase)